MTDLTDNEIWNKVKPKDTSCSASSRRNLATEVLVYGTCCQGITVLSVTHTLNQKWNEQYPPSPSQPKRNSFINPGGMEGQVALCNTTVSKQSASNCYMTAITVVSCSNCHASLGNWRAGAIGVEPLTSQATPLSTELVSPLKNAWRDQIELTNYAPKNVNN